MLSETLSRKAKELSRREFAEQFRDCFLIYGLGTPVQRSTDFKTGTFPALHRKDNVQATMRISALSAMQAVNALHGTQRNESGVLLVTKTDRNPYSDRISIGRANSCDMVLPVLLVSKLHAHFLRSLSAAGGWDLRDAESTNGTWVNGTRAQPGERVAIRPGDTVRLAYCEARFVDASGLFDYYHSQMPALK